MSDGSGERFNKDKLRYDLVPTFAQEQYAGVLTFGAKKYGDQNWKKGMSWSTVLASLERHLEAIKKGEDYDKETNMLHSAHIMCNAAFLTEYYRIYPQGDDRRLALFNMPSVAIEIDKFLHDQRANQKNETLGFLPQYYLSSFVDNKWLDLNGFPQAEIIPCDEVLVETLKEKKVKVVVSANMARFLELNKKGIFCYLLDSPGNQSVDVGHRRLPSLKDLKF